MRKVRLTESDLIRVIERIIKEQQNDAKQVAGPFGPSQPKYYIFEKGGKFYIYQTNATQKTPILMQGSAYSNNGKGYNSSDEAKTNIDILLKKPDIKEQSLTGGKSKPEFKGRLAKSKKDFGMGWRDEYDYPSEGPGERAGSVVSYEDFARFAEDHPDLAEFYFGWGGDKSGEVFDYYGGLDLFNPEEDMANLEEMKRKVRVMENKLKRKMRRK